MLKHIVMWRLKDEVDGATREENAATLKQRLENLTGRIPRVRTLEVGLNINDASPAAFDVVLYTVFDDAEALAAYQEHPDHRALLAFVRSIVTDRCVVDYEIAEAG